MFLPLPSRVCAHVALINVTMMMSCRVTTRMPTIMPTTLWWRPLGRLCERPVASASTYQSTRDDDMVAPAWHRITWISARACQLSDHLVCAPSRHQCWVIVHVCHLLTCHGWVFQRAVGKTSSGGVVACTCRHLPIARSSHEGIARRGGGGEGIPASGCEGSPNKRRLDRWFPEVVGCPQ